MPQGSKVGLLEFREAGQFPNCGGNEPDDILKFP